MKEDLKAVGVFVATLVGAGFASGSEIVYYFVRYGKLSFFAVMLASFLFAYFAAEVVRISKENAIDTFADFLRKIFGNRLAQPVILASYIFIFITLCAMLSGSAESLYNVFLLPRRWGTVLTATVVFGVLIFGARGLSAVDGVISVVIITGILCICWYLYTFREISVFNNMSKALASGTVYVGYNILAAGGVLTSFAKKITSPKRVGVISGVIIFALMMLLWGIISIYYRMIPLGELPMLTICKRHGKPIYYSYFAVLFSAMLSTAISNAFLLAGQGRGGRKIRLAAVIAAGLLLSGLPLGFFVDKLYRLVGILGGVVMIIIILKKPKKIKFIRKTKKKREK